MRSKKQFHFFAEITESDDDLIRFTNSFEAFEQAKANHEKKSYWNAFNLVPTAEEVGIALGSKYFNKVICEFAANGNASEFHRLYNDVNASEVWEYIAIRTAVNYVPKDNNYHEPLTDD